MIVVQVVLHYFGVFILYRSITFELLRLRELCKS